MTSFVASVLKLATGAAAGQLITVAAMPILTRIYTPDQFGVLALFSAVLSIFIAIACCRLEIAIPIPERTEDALGLSYIALISATFLSFLVFLTVVFFYDYLLVLKSSEGFGYVLILLPIGIMVGAVYNVLTYWSMRKNDFGRIGKTKIYQSLSAFFVQVTFGILGFPIVGLLVGYVASLGAGSGSLVGNWLCDLKKHMGCITSVFLREILCRYRFYPKYSTFEALINSFGTHAPVLIIAASLPSRDAGLLMLAIRAMQSPMALIGGSISQVFLSRAPLEYRSGTLNQLANNVLLGLFKSGVPVILFLALIAPNLFEIAFGKIWREAGEIVVWMIPWFVFQFVSSPISTIMHVSGRQRDLLLLNIFGVVLRVGSVFAGVFFSGNASIFYALSSGVFYLFCFYVFSKASGLNFFDMLTIVQKASQYIAGSIFLAIVINWLVF